MKTETTFSCGWCGADCSSEEDKIIHEPECEIMFQFQKEEMERDERRRMENQLWEEEHAAGRI